MRIIIIIIIIIIAFRALSDPPPRTMNVPSTVTLAYSEADIQAAILAIKNKQYPSIRKAAAALNIPYPTLRGRMSGRKSRSSAHETEQILSAAE